MPTYTDSICSPAMTSDSSTAFLTASMAWSRLMMLPRRVPFIGEVPLPMISSWLRSLASPTSTQTFDVPMSSATTYFSSVFGIDCSSFGLRRRGHRSHGFDDDAIGEAEVGVGNVAAAELFRAGDGVEVAPLRREVARVGVDDRAELAVEEREGVGGDGADFGHARVQLGIMRAEVAQQRHAGSRLARRDQRKVAVADRRRELGERGAALVDVLQFVAVLQQRHRPALDDADAQRVRQLLFRLDAADPAELA